MRNHWLLGIYAKYLTCLESKKLKKKRKDQLLDVFAIPEDQFLFFHVI